MDEQILELIDDYGDARAEAAHKDAGRADWERCDDAKAKLIASLSQPAAAQVPLTDDQIKTACGASDVYWAHSKLFIKAIAKATEAAHGIA